MAYGLTGYGVAKIGWLFDAEETAINVWQPISYISGFMAVVGGIWTFELLMRKVDPVKRSIDLT